MSLLSPSDIETCRGLAQPFVYVGMVNHRFRNSCFKLMEDWQRLNLTSVFLICLDETIYLKLQAQYPTVALCGIQYPVSIPDASFWAFRLGILAELLEAGIPTVMVDMDTEWVQDPTPYLQTLVPRYSMVISQGRDYPINVFKAQGFTLCSGFLLVMPTDETKYWVQKWIEATTANVDDDVALNKLLGLQARTTTYQFPTPLKGLALRSSTQPVPGQWIKDGKTMAFAVLPWNKFPRAQLLSNRDQILVAHYHERKW